MNAAVVTEVLLMTVLLLGAVVKAADIPGTRGEDRRRVRLLSSGLGVLALGQLLSLPFVADLFETRSEGAGKLVHHAVSFVGLFLVLSFFARLDGRLRHKGRVIGRDAALIAAVLAAMVALLAWTPRNLRDTGLESPLVEFPTVAWFYLLGDLLFVYVSVRCIRGVGADPGRLGRGVTVARRAVLAGLTGLVAAAVLRAGRVVVVLLDGRDPVWVVEPARHLTLLATGLVVAGFTVCGIGRLADAARWWVRRRRQYARLEPLWTLLTGTYPDVVLGAPGRRGRWVHPEPAGLRYRFHRRVVECRDGLLCLGPTLAAVSGTSDLTGWTAPAVAERIRTAVASAGETEAVADDTGSSRVLPDSAESTLDAEVDVLVAISVALRRMDRGDVDEPVLAGVS